jgi:2-polyprenyl-3-methyl-5-hydroxy-6-metoxy-1,4-benzoquinol methylase
MFIECDSLRRRTNAVFCELILIQASRRSPMQLDSATETQPNPGLILEMVNAHQRSSALTAAIELGVFRAVGEGAADVTSIALHCKSSERGIRILCDFLVIHGVLAKNGKQYSHTPTSAVFLDPKSPACMASVAKFMSNPQVNEGINLTEIVRNGRTSLPGQGTVEPDNPLWVVFAENMAPMTGPLAGPLAEIILKGHSGQMQVLDIAAGHGLFGVAIAKQNTNAHITALDWPNVLKVAHRNAAAAGVQDRYSLLQGSAFDVEFGGPYDVVLLTNFLHHFDPPTCIGLLKKVRAALQPGGRVATVEFVPNEDRVSPPAAAAFSLTMLTTTVAGDAYTLSELTAMHSEAGFHAIVGRPIPMSPQSVVIGEA